MPYDGIQGSQRTSGGSTLAGWTRASIDCHMNCSKLHIACGAATSVGRAEPVNQATSAVHALALPAAAIGAEVGGAGEQAASARPASAGSTERVTSESGSGWWDMKIPITDSPLRERGGCSTRRHRQRGAASSADGPGERASPASDSRERYQCSRAKCKLRNMT